MSYCLKITRNTERKNPKFVKTKNGWIILSSNSAACGNKKSRIIKEQGPSGLLSRFRIGTPLSPLLSLLF